MEERQPRDRAGVPDREAAPEPAGPVGDAEGWGSSEAPEQDVTPGWAGGAPSTSTGGIGGRGVGAAHAGGDAGHEGGAGSGGDSSAPGGRGPAIGDLWGGRDPAAGSGGFPEGFGERGLSGVFGIGGHDRCGDAGIGDVGIVTPVTHPVSRRSMVLLALLAVPILVLGIVFLLVDRQSARTAVGAPEMLLPSRVERVQLVRMAHSGLCLAVDDGGGTALGQHPCDDERRAVRLERFPDETYWVLVGRPGGGDGCATADGGGTGTGARLVVADCGDGRADQRFLLDPVGRPTTGYRLRSASGQQWCVGVPGADTRAGAPLVQDACVEGAHQVLVLDELKLPPTSH